MSKFIIRDLDEITTVEDRVQYLKEKLHAVEREIWLVRKALYDIEQDCYDADTDDQYSCILEELDVLESDFSDLDFDCFVLIDETINRENQLIRRK